MQPRSMQHLEYPLRLCVELIRYASLGGNGKTNDMRGSEIKGAARVFFTDEMIEEAIDILTGR